MSGPRVQGNFFLNWSVHYVSLDGHVPEGVPPQRRQEGRQVLLPPQLLRQRRVLGCSPPPPAVVGRGKARRRHRPRAGRPRVVLVPDAAREGTAEDLV